MKIMITGGAGFLGSHIALRLTELGHSVSILGRSEQSAKHLIEKGIKFHKVDIRNSELVDKAISHHEVVIHCAALASPFGQYHKFYSINFEGTKNIVNSCIKNKITKLVNLSTPSIYFNYEDRILIKESDPIPKPQVTYYASTKLLADKYIQDAFDNNEINVTTLRPRAIFGIGDQTITPRIMNSKILGLAPLIRSGQAWHDITYIDNVVDAVVLAMSTEQKISGKTYNITNGEPMRIKDIFELFHKTLKKEVRFIHIPYSLISLIASTIEFLFTLKKINKEPKLTKFGVGLFGHSQTLDISLAKTELKYQPRFSIKEGIEKVANAKRV